MAVPPVRFSTRPEALGTRRSAVATHVAEQQTGARPRLRRELGFLGALMLSIGIMAPTGALSINGVPAAGLVGKGVPVAFILASLGILPVAYGFIRLSQHISHAGSVYAFCGITIGPRTGFVGGWSLAAIYTAFTAGEAALIGLFGSAFFAFHGITVHWYWVGLVVTPMLAILAYLEVKNVTRILLVAEGVSLLLVAILFVIIYSKIATGTAPHHQTLTLAPFSLPHGISLSVLGFASVLGFLSFAGFEGTATLGEDSRSPRKIIPRVLFFLVLGLAVYFIFGMYTEVIGFGATAQGVKAFSGSTSALADLAALYVGKGLASAITIGAMLSICGAFLGTTVAASRVIFALSRDGFGPQAFSRVSRRFGTPYIAISFVMAATFAAVIAFAIEGTNGVNAFFYPGTLGTLLLLCMYILTEYGAINYFFVQRRIRVRSVESIIPAVGIVIIGYVLYRNVWPVPAAPFNWIAYLTGFWIAVGAIIALAAPGLAKSIGTNLMVDEMGAQVAELGIVESAPAPPVAVTGPSSSDASTP
jgi:amino acid transporter